MAENKKIQFKQGLLAKLPAYSASNAGTLYFTTDEGAIYLDGADGRVRFGDVIQVANIAALPAQGHAFETAIYYAKAENVLARWDKGTSKWVQLNASGLTKVNVTGGGNVIAGLSVEVDPVTGAKALTATTASVATSTALEALDTRVENLEAHDEDYVAADTTVKTTLLGEGGVATTHTIKGAYDKAATAQSKANTADSTANKNKEDLGKLNTKVTKLESAYVTADTAVKEALLGTDGVEGDHTIKGAYDKAAAASSAASTADGKAVAAQNAADQAQKEVDALEKLHSALDTKVQGIDTAYKAADTAINEKLDVINGSAETPGSIAHAINGVIDGAPAAFDTLKEVSDWISNDETGAAALTNRVAENEKAIGTLNTTTSGHTTSISNLVAADTRIEKEYKEADTKVKTDLTGSVGDGPKGSNTIIGVSERAKAAQDKADANETAHGKLSTKVTKLTSTVNAMDGAYKDADTAVKKAIWGEETSAHTLKSLDGRITAAQEKADKGVEDAGTAQAKANSNATAIAGHGTRITAVETQLTWGTF